MKCFFIHMDEHGANGYEHGQFCQAKERPITLKVGKQDISRVQLGCTYTFACVQITPLPCLYVISAV